MLPESDEKHLKLLSQKPQTKMTSQLGGVAKQADDADTLWSNGSPSLVFSPEPGYMNYHIID